MTIDAKLTFRVIVVLGAVTILGIGYLALRKTKVELTDSSGKKITGTTGPTVGNDEDEKA